uniref:Uncharacterized protein n=1 Tax=Rhizophora mucronata TaxID=61149 RepID=A0A2P2MZ71_RHIMU
MDQLILSKLENQPGRHVSIKANTFAKIFFLFKVSCFPNGNFLCQDPTYEVW